MTARHLSTIRVVAPFHVKLYNAETPGNVCYVAEPPDHESYVMVEMRATDAPTNAVQYRELTLLMRRFLIERCAYEALKGDRRRG